MPFISPSWPSDLPEPQVYKNLSSLIIRAIQKTSLPDNDLSKNGHWTTLGDCLRQMSGFDIVHSLVQSTKFRDSLYHVLKDVPHRDKMQEREAIVKDETDIVSLFGRVLDSDEQKEVVFSLQGDEADSFMILAQTILDDWSKLHRMSLSHSGGGADKSDLFFNFNEKFRRDVHKLQINLSLRCQQLPSSICVLGVQLRSKDSARGGSFADVFQGGLGETEVALKRLRVSHDSRRNQLSIQKMLFKEALMWQTLKHRYILPFLGIDAVSFVPMYCMVSPWMRHGDILKFLETSASMQVDIDELLLEITEGLNYLHQSGMIHGDLRGSNILIDDDHHPRLADFGLATIADVTKGASSTNHGGSSQWMAPELHFPDKFNLPLKRTFASDVYALGCVYLEVYTRNQPFPSCSEGQLILKLNEGFRPKRPTPVQCMERTLSDALWSLIENCWSEIAAERPSTGMALRAMEDICKRTETTPTNECPPLPEVTSGLLTYPPTRHLSALPATENSTEQRWPPGTMDLSPISSNPIQAHAQEFCVICHIRPKYSFGDIKYDFCSDTCAAEWDRTCGISGCEQPVIRDGAQAFEVCFKHYEMFRANFCLFCRTNCRMWDTLDDPFCADPCARAAVASAPILLEVPNTHPMFTRVAESFGESWGGESKTPVVARVFRVISSSQVQDMHESFRQGIISSRSLGQTSGNQDRRWYGPRCACTLGQSQPTGICSSNTCGICCMMTSSAYTSGEITSWRRFGSGFYTSSTASKFCDRLVQQSHPILLKPLLLCEVTAGNVYTLDRNEPAVQSPPGYDSVGELSAVESPKVTPRLRAPSQSEQSSPRDHGTFPRAISSSTRGLSETVRTYSANGGRRPKRPCAFYNTPKGCYNGDECEFSHDKSAASGSQSWRRTSGNSFDNLQAGVPYPRNGRQSSGQPTEPKRHSRPANEYDGLVVFDQRAILPLYLVMYEQ